MVKPNKTVKTNWQTADTDTHTQRIREIKMSIQTSSNAELKLLAAGAWDQPGAVCWHVVAVVCRVDVDTKRRSCQPFLFIRSFIHFDNTPYTNDLNGQNHKTRHKMDCHSSIKVRTSSKLSRCHFGSTPGRLTQWVIQEARAPTSLKCIPRPKNATKKLP